MVWLSRVGILPKVDGDSWVISRTMLRVLLGLFRAGQLREPMELPWKVRVLEMMVRRRSRLGIPKLKRLVLMRMG
jgi:hypothetical protein